MKEFNRQKFLGGSDAAAVFGLSEWRTPLQVYFQKTGQTPPKDLEIDPAKLKMFRRGKLMEPVVIRMLQDETPIKIVRKSSAKTPNRYVDKEFPFLAAEIDFEWEVTQHTVDYFADNGVVIDPGLIGSIQNGEVKTAHPFVAMKKFGEEGTDEIPIEYAAQAMHGLMVKDRELCIFPVLVGSDNLIIYWVRRDEALIAEMRKRCVEFWINNVQAGVPPDPIRLPDIFALFKRMGETRREATPEVLDWIKQYDEAKSTAKAAHELEEELQFRIGEFLLGAGKYEEPDPDTGKHVVTLDGKPMMTVEFQQQFRLWETAVKVKYPKVAEECVRLSQFFVFKRNKPRNG